LSRPRAKEDVGARGESNHPSAKRNEPQDTKTRRRGKAKREDVKRDSSFTFRFFAFIQVFFVLRVEVLLIAAQPRPESAPSTTQSFLFLAFCGFLCLVLIAGGLAVPSRFHFGRRWNAQILIPMSGRRDCRRVK
jgi:hypothetical protein